MKTRLRQESSLFVAPQMEPPDPIRVTALSAFPDLNVARSMDGEKGSGGYGKGEKERKERQRESECPVTNPASSSSLEQTRTRACTQPIDLVRPTTSPVADTCTHDVIETVLFSCAISKSLTRSILLCSLGNLALRHRACPLRCY